jgi:hypothetical protein
MDNYKTIETKLANRQAFTGNTLRAIQKDNGYFVYSYHTLIAVYNYNPIPDTVEGVTLDWERVQRWVDPTKYSVTTTRQQNLIKRAWGI